MKTDSQPDMHPVTTEYMYCAFGAPEPTQAMPLPPKSEPSRRSVTRSAPVAVRRPSTAPNVAASNGAPHDAGQAGEIA